MFLWAMSIKRTGMCDRSRNLRQHFLRQQLRVPGHQPSQIDPNTVISIFLRHASQITSQISPKTLGDQLGPGGQGLFEPPRRDRAASLELPAAATRRAASWVDTSAQGDPTRATWSFSPLNPVKNLIWTSALPGTARGCDKSPPPTVPPQPRRKLANAWCHGRWDPRRQWLETPNN